MSFSFESGDVWPIYVYGALRVIGRDRTVAEKVSTENGLKLRLVGAHYFTIEGPAGPCLQSAVSISRREKDFFWSATVDRSV